MPTIVRYALALLVFLLVPDAAAQPLTGFTAEATSSQRSCEAALKEVPSAEAFRRHLKALTRDPHPAGSAANRRVAAYIDSVMAGAGLTVERYPYDLYMPSPNAAHDVDVALVTPIRRPLNRQEYVLPSDPYSAHPDLTPAWNAYSGSGDVTAEVVYANYGRKQDFEWLAENDVSVVGKIVLARYGGNFRGYKAKYAEEYGAAGLIMYTDPADGGYADGLPYPDGRHLSESTIQRGSVLTPLSGDPLTPAGPSLPDGEGAERLDPDEADLPTIPVTPLPHASAQHILERMTGRAVPDGWQGALPFTYRVTGGPGLTVRLRVNQPKQMVRASNVIGRIEGTDHPDQWVVLGAHYDAWTFGAVDPNSGTATLLLIAEALGELSEAGCRPRRSILIGHWDAEEYGILGSTEWVEQFHDELHDGGVAYINADAAVSGDRFSGASAPSLKQPLLDAAGAVAHPSADTMSVRDRAQARQDGEDQLLGNLGGGSDHVGFYTFAGVPSLGAGMKGASPIYHSAYDNFAWYERFADTTFVHGPALARVDGILALRLANADVLPYDVVRYATDLRAHLNDLSDHATDAGAPTDFERLHTAIDSLETAAEAFVHARDTALAKDAGTIPDGLNKDMIGLEKAFLHAPGLQGNPLKRSLYASPDPFSGYASWMLPGLRYEIDAGTPDGLARWTSLYVDAVTDLTGRVQRATERLD